MGAQLTPIGDEKVDEWFADMFDVDKRANLTCAVDPIRKLVCWAFTSTDSTDGENDLILFYHYALKRWSYAALAADLLFPLYQPGFTLEGLDAISSSIDALEISLDDPSLAGGEFAFAAGIADRIATFSGQPLNGTVETAEQGMPQNTLVRRVYPLTDGAASGTCRSPSPRASRNRRAWPTADGDHDGCRLVPTRAAGRYHRIKLHLTGETWDQIHGLEVDVEPWASDDGFQRLRQEGDEPGRSRDWSMLRWTSCARSRMRAGRSSPPRRPRMSPSRRLAMSPRPMCKRLSRKWTARSWL